MTTVNNEKDLTEVQWLREQIRQARDSESSAKYAYNEEKIWRRQAEKRASHFKNLIGAHWAAHLMCAAALALIAVGVI